VSGEGNTVVGRGTEPLPTAMSVDSSITNCPQAAVGPEGTVPMDPDPVLPDPDPVPAGAVVCVVAVGGEPVAGLDDVPAPGDAPPPPSWGTLTGCAHTAPVGHRTGPGTVPTGGGQAASSGEHPPVVPLPVA
jgi:hypothetical protein